MFATKFCISDFENYSNLFQNILKKFNHLFNLIITSIFNGENWKVTGQNSWNGIIKMRSQSEFISQWKFENLFRIVEEKLDIFFQ